MHFYAYYFGQNSNFKAITQQLKALKGSLNVLNRIIKVLVFNTLFYKNNFIRTRGSFLLRISEQIKNNPSLDSTEEQSFKFSIEVVNKTAASATQLVKCI